MVTWSGQLLAAAAHHRLHAATFEWITFLYVLEITILWTNNNHEVLFSFVSTAFIGNKRVASKPCVYGKTRYIGIKHPFKLLRWHDTLFCRKAVGRAGIKRCKPMLIAFNKLGFDSRLIMEVEIKEEAIEYLRKIHLQNEVPLAIK